MKSRSLLVAIISVATILTLCSQDSRSFGRSGANDQKGYTLPGPGATWSLAACGDAIITRRIAQFDNPSDPRFQQMVRVIQEADAAFLNLELSLFRLSEFKGWPEVENGGNWELGPPEVAEDLKAMGFDMVSRANNHTTDYGVEGMRLTNRLLDGIGIVHSGSGENLGQASRPGYFESARGRIGLISVATTFTNMSRAGSARPEVVGRPGLNALRLDTRHEADPATFAALREIAAKMGGRVPRDRDAALRMFGTNVHLGSDCRAIETINPGDEARILHEVRNAAKLADFVVVNSHSHQPGNSSVVTTTWMEEFAKKCIDAGAVTFIIHGPHQLRGIEIYKGKPIFYSLGNFVFQNETIDPMPADNYERYNLSNNELASDLYDTRFRGGTIGFPSSPVWYESVIAVPTFKGTQLTELKLYPIDMGQKAPRSQRGTPRIADPTTGKKIIEHLAKLSAPLGTKIVYENGICIWRKQD